ncbi:MAG: aminotransferase class V-fold PLP-dependent enzyme [Terriglobales bacterium]
MPFSHIRDQFPITRHYAYLNHAAIAPLANSTRQAIEAHLAEQAEGGALHFFDWLAALDRARATFAGLIHATEADIALCKNTTEGLATVAAGLDWRAGDRIVSFECEFPANLYPWLGLRGRQVTVELLPAEALADLDRVRSACRGAKLLAISFVQYLSGFRAPLSEIGDICRETGTWLVVDAIQGLGALPLDAPACGVHALACGSHKWLTGPEGGGFLYVHPALLDQLTPPQPGWLSVADWADFDAGAKAAASTAPLAWRIGAARLECGMLNGPGLLGLAAAVELLQSAGAEAAANHILDLSQRLQAGLRRRGCQLCQLSSRREHLSGITSFQHPREDSAAVTARLEAAHILCSHRGAWIRVSPHLYNTADEIDSLLAALPQ